jgi:hypothetical protein
MVLFKNTVSKLLITTILISCSGPSLFIKGPLKINKKQLDRIATGETKDSAINSLSYPALIFFESFWPNKKTVIISPVGSDLILQDDKKYETWFFYTKYQKKDGKATRDETTPYIFLNNRFYGKGWKTYDSLSAK